MAYVNVDTTSTEESRIHHDIEDNGASLSSFLSFGDHSSTSYSALHLGCLPMAKLKRACPSAYALCVHLNLLHSMPSIARRVMFLVVGQEGDGPFRRIVDLLSHAPE